MEYLIIAMLLGLIPAAIADGKGRSFFWFWVYGTLLFIIALIHSLIMNPSTQEAEYRSLASGDKRCPHCAEVIKGQAGVCRFCGRDV